MLPLGIGKVAALQGKEPVDRRAASEIAGVQYLRGLAALAVLLFHTSETYHLGFPVGAAGVDVFFVISGFIMWITTADRGTSPATFLRRRLSRIVPIYWLATIVTAAGIALKPQFFFHHDGSIGNIARSMLFVPIQPNGDFHPVVIQGWTLCYEMFFYLLFAAALPIKLPHRSIALIISLIALACIHTFVGNPYLLAMTSPLLLEFAGGIIAGLLWTSPVNVPIVFSGAMLGSGVGFLAIDNHYAFGLPRFVGWGIPAFLIVCGIILIEKRKKFPEIRPLHFLGDASYSIYIWHVVAAIAVTAILLRFGTPAKAMPFLVVSGSLALTLGAYLGIERPINRAIHLRRRETISEGNRNIRR